MLQNIISFLTEKTVFQNTLLDYVISFFIFILGLIFIKVFNKIVLKRLKVWTEKSTVIIDDFLVRIVEKALIPLLYFGVFYLSIRSLILTAYLTKVINVLGVTILTILTIRFSVAMITYILENYWLKKEKDMAKKKSFQTMITITKVVVWGLGIIFLLDNLGFKISTVIAGLGIGGVAIALAVQSVLGDLLSYFAIFLDRPFEIGDFVIIDDYLGVVEHIGIKTTRICSLGGEQLVFSNADLTNSRLRNYKRMNKRRVVFKLGVTYQTGLKQLKEIPIIITNIIKGIDNTVFDRAHFFSYGDFSLIFEVVYYVLSSDYNKYMDVQQEINFAIKEEFEKRKIEFAYPTQTLFLNSDSAVTESVLKTIPSGLSKKKINK